MFDTRTRRKPVVRPHSELVRVHTLDDLLKRPEVENKDLPSGIPGGRSDGIGEFLPPDPNIPVPRLPEADPRKSPSGLTKEDLKDARKKDLLTAAELTRDPRKNAEAPAAETPEINDLSEHMLFKDVTRLETQREIATAPERGLEARTRMLQEEEDEKEARALSASPKTPSGTPGGELADPSGAAEAPPGAAAADRSSDPRQAAYPDALLASPSARVMMREQEEKERADNTFARSRELMAAITTPHLEADRARRQAGRENDLQRLTASYRDAAARSQPALGASPATASPAPSTALSQASVGTSVGGPSGLGTFPAPLGSSPLGSFTPASTEVRLGGSSAPARFADASASPAYNLPSAALAPSPLAVPSGGSDLLRQRRLDQGRVRSQMDALPGQSAPGRFQR